MSLIPLGFWAASGGGGGGAFDLLETTTLTSSASSVTFSGLDSFSDYKHLQIRAVVQPSITRSLNMTLNGETTSYAWHALRGSGSAVQTQGAYNKSSIQTGESINGPVTSVYAPYVIDILDFANTSKNTTVRLMYGNIYAGNYWVGLTSGLLNSTDAISSTSFYFNSANHVAGTRFSLYGVK